MKVGTAVLLALGAWAAAAGARAYVRGRVARNLPAGVRPPPRELRVLSAQLHDECVEALRGFAAEYRRSFRHGGCSKEAVLALHRLRQGALGSMYGLRMRLPNDLGGEAALTRHIEETDGLLRAYIAEVQARCPDAALLHPGPIDDMFYRRHYRAFNDEPA